MTSSMSCSTRRTVMPEARMLRICLDQMGALGGVHAGRRLVQQEQPGLGSQSTGDLHQALRPVGQAGGR